MTLPLAFEVSGDGPPVVILHGLMDSASNWHAMARQLAPRHRVLCVDLRNHGASPWAGTMSYREMAADVRQLIDSQGLQHPTVIGHSMGGKVAMALALESPASVGRLIVVDVVPVSYNDRIAVLLQNLMSRNEHFDWRANFAAIGGAIRGLGGFPAELLGRRYDGPVTLIYGTRSVYVTPDDSTAFATLFPQAELHQIDGAGHWVHADRPAEFLAALRMTQVVAA